jgi:AraC-like DNA-binding protein
MEPGELHANVRSAPVADFGVILIEPVRFAELLDVARGYAGWRPALRTAQLFHPGIERKVHEALSRVRAGDAPGADDTLLELVNALCEHGVYEFAGASRKTPYERDATRRAIELIQDAWAEPLTLGEIARGVGVPASTLSHAFKKHVGLGLRQYRLRVRLERARRMIRDRSGDIAAIAAECGFFDTSGFSHAFKDFFGVTPSAYRISVVGG